VVRPTRFLISALAILLLAFTPLCFAATPEQVEIAIERGKNRLYALQTQAGHWEGDLAGTHVGGFTAMATYALLAAGEPPQDPRVEAGISWLVKNDIGLVYALGLRSQIWSLIPMTDERKRAVRKDATNLIEWGLRNGGLYHYFANDGSYDHSCSQYGLLGVWGCAQAGIEVPREYWEVVDKAWRDHQNRDGGWSYGYSPSGGKGNESTPSMTAAGVASLFVTLDHMLVNQKWECKGNIQDKQIEKGLNWMSKNFEDVFTSGHLYYTLYGVERIGLASGYKYFNNVNWYDRGADFLVTSQDAAGGWGDVPSTCFGILFLARGRAPVVMNKLQYEIFRHGDKGPPANWNQRPRDAANVVRWIGKQTERFLNWQIVNLSAPVEELHDAPILYIAGNQQLMFSEEEERKLRLFCEQGGIILANADCAGAQFTASFRKLGTKLFPNYEFRELPVNHPIYTGQSFDRKKWSKPPSVLGLSNGARELMLIVPQADVGKTWQQALGGENEPAHSLAANIYLYAIESNNARFKGQTHIVHSDVNAHAETTIRLARLEYAGNWDPEPAGWRRLNAIFRNHYGVDLQDQVVKLGSGKLDPARCPVAHLTGTGKLKFDDAVRKELRAYIDAGGTLIIDAAGGSSDFAQTIDDFLPKLVPEARHPLPVLEPAHPVLQQPIKLDTVEYRKFALKTLGNLKAPRLRGAMIKDRIRVFYSREDLSVGLVGQTVDGIHGYNSRTATSMMINLILYGAKVERTADPSNVKSILREFDNTGSDKNDTGSGTDTTEPTKRPARKVPKFRFHDDESPPPEGESAPPQE
jgi:hypothetical protein